MLRQENIDTTKKRIVKTLLNKLKEYTLNNKIKWKIEEISKTNVYNNCYKTTLQNSKKPKTAELEVRIYNRLIDGVEISLKDRKANKETRYRFNLTNNTDKELQDELLSIINDSFIQSKYKKEYDTFSKLEELINSY